MSDRLGHATTAFTQDVYMHAIPELEHDAADQIADLVFGSSEGVGTSAPQGSEVARAGDADELEDEESAGG